MSTKVSTAYNALIYLLGTTLFPQDHGYARLPNAYDAEANPDTMLKLGWSLAPGQAVNTDKFVGTKFSVARNFVLTLTRKYEGLRVDESGKGDVELAIYEDQRLIINALEKDFSVGGETVYTKYVGDDGIEYVRTAKENFLMLKTNVILEYFEDLT